MSEERITQGNVTYLDARFFDIARPDQTNKGNEYILARVSDEALAGRKIHAGDTIIVRRTTSIQDRDLVVLDSPAGSLLRHVFFDDGTVRLEASNPDYPSLRFSRREVEVQGVAMWVLTAMS